MIRPLFTALLILYAAASAAQALPDTSVIEISGIRESKEILDKTSFVAKADSKANPTGIAAAEWKPLSRLHLEKYIPDTWITRPVFLRFTLRNSADTAIAVYFHAGSYIRKMETYKAGPSGQISRLADESEADGYQPVSLKGGEEQSFIIKINYTKRNFNSLRPLLVSKDHLNSFKRLAYFRNDAQPMVGYLLGGILLMMIFFTAANYLQSGKKEFLYNCCYSLCMFGLIFLNTFLERKNGFLTSLFNEYLDFALLATGTICYIAFTRKFLDTETKYPLLNRIFRVEEIILIVILACFTIIVFGTDNFRLQKILENGMKFIALAIGVVYIFIALSKDDKLMGYLAIGNSMLIVFSAISFYMILYQPRNDNILTNSMVYYEIGIVSELAFFLFGLAYKNRVELIEKTKEQESLKLEAERLSYETKLAVLNAQQHERNRISADMHDNLGAGVTAIRLYSELAKKRIGREVIPEIEKISSSANDLLNNMNAIIWTMSSSNDSLDNMIAYIRSYALEYFENTGINCRIMLEEDIPNIPVSGEIRRNIFLVVKEALNNILKHSKASEVCISLKKEGSGISLYIQDNGTGIDFEKLRRFGNGLRNMKRRMEETKILFTIENKNGTLIRLHRQLKL